MKKTIYVVLTVLTISIFFACQQDSNWEGYYKSDKHATLKISHQTTKSFDFIIEANNGTDESYVAKIMGRALTLGDSAIFVDGASKRKFYFHYKDNKVKIIPYKEDYSYVRYRISIFGEFNRVLNSKNDSVAKKQDTIKSDTIKK